MPLVCKFFSLLLLFVVHYLHAQVIQSGLDNDSPCDCKSIFECASLKAFLDRREFSVLRTHKSCGFERKVPKYCCPSVESITPKPKTVTEASFPPLSVSGRIKIEELLTSTQNPRDAFFADLKKVCGLANSNRIFGGKSVGNHEYPWLAALVYDDCVRCRCGGVLVSHNVIATAAHCILDKFKMNKVRLGHADLNRTKEFEVVSVTLHPDYDINDAGIPDNDLALIKIAEDLVFDIAVKPICLPEKSDDSWQNEIANVAGWGFTENLSLSNVLLQVSLKFVNQSVCQADIRSKGVGNFTLTPSQICAQGLLGEDSCMGDSGGPLMYLNRQHTVLIGITSFGTRQCDSSVPGVYTDISKYKNWISDFMYNNHV